MKKLLVLSGKGGTGKTTISSAIIALSKAKAFADCDVDAPNLHILKKFENKPSTFDFIGGNKAYLIENKCVGCGQCEKYCNFGAIKMVKNKAVIDEYACEGCGVCGYICPNNAVEIKKDLAGSVLLYDEEEKFSTAHLKMGRGNSGKLVSEVKTHLFKVAKEGELAVLDGSPGVGCPVMSSISGVDFVLVVTEPTISGKSDLERIIKTLEVTNVNGGVCVNKYNLNSQMADEIENWCKSKNIPFLGKISYDKRASECINSGKSVVETNCTMSDEIKNIFSNVKKIMEI